MRPCHWSADAGGGVARLATPPLSQQFPGVGGAGDGRVRVETLRHLVADDVDERLKHDLHVVVVLRRRLKELQTCAPTIE